jgi:hypothetical protein
MELKFYIVVSLPIERLVLAALKNFQVVGFGEVNPILIFPDLIYQYFFFVGGEVGLHIKCNS